MQNVCRINGGALYLQYFDYLQGIKLFIFENILFVTIKKIICTIYLNPG